MRQHHIMRLGPLDHEGGSLFEYVVFPGKESNDVYYAADDESAIANILYDYKASELVCEEALAAACGPLGVEAQPLSQIAALGLDLFAYDRFPGTPFQNITEETLVYRFCEMTQRHFEILSEGRDFLFRPLRLHVSGSVEFVTDLYLHKPEGNGDFLSLMMEKASAGILPEPVSAESLQPFNRLSVVRHKEPAFIIDALRRAHGLDFIPVPWRTMKGAMSGITDMQLAILVSTLNAISYLNGSGDIGKSEFAIRQHQVDCVVCLADS